MQLQVFQEQTDAATIIERDYGLDEFLAEVEWREPDRCRSCYELRLDRTARRACDDGFNAFSSTLLLSIHQKHELVREVGEAMAARHGVEFVYRDLRPLFDEAQAEARRRSLYVQQYCGCIFSENERFRETGRYL